MRRPVTGASASRTQERVATHPDVQSNVAETRQTFETTIHLRITNLLATRFVSGCGRRRGEPHHLAGSLAQGDVAAQTDRSLETFRFRSNVPHAVRQAGRGRTVAPAASVSRGETARAAANAPRAIRIIATGARIAPG